MNEHILILSEFWGVKNQQSIYFYYNTPIGYFPSRNKLKNFILTLCRKEGKKVAEIRIIFCDKKELRSINRQFLQHDYDTDIITFPFSTPNSPLEAELYISVPKIKEQSKEWNCSFQEELHRIIFHGVLHLCGYNDKKKKEITIMREKEQEYLADYFGLK